MSLTVNSVPKEGYKYIPLSQRGEKAPFTVYVKPLDSRDILQLEDEVVVKKGEDMVFLASGAYAFKVVQKAMQSWENINGPDGKPLKLEKDLSGRAADHSISNIPSDMITEISNAVSAISRDPGTFQLYFEE